MVRPFSGLALRLLSAVESIPLFAILLVRALTIRGMRVHFAGFAGFVLPKNAPLTGGVTLYRFLFL
jgi:hypothetical protein